MVTSKVVLAVVTATLITWATIGVQVSEAAAGQQLVAAGPVKRAKLTTTVEGWPTNVARVTPGRVVIQEVRVSSHGRYVKRLVDLQRKKTGSRWKTLSRATTRSDGRVTVRMPAGLSGRSQFRLRVPAKGSYRGVVTPARLVAVGTSGAVSLVSSSKYGVPGNDSSTDPQVSPEGSRVMFTSSASNLVAGDTNGSQDVFVKDLTTGDVALVSSNGKGTPGNGDSGGGRWSPDGNRVLFGSRATNLAAEPGTGDVFIKELAVGGINRVISTGVPWDSYGDLAWSPDGKSIYLVGKPQLDTGFDCTAHSTLGCTATALLSVRLLDSAATVVACGRYYGSAGYPCRVWGPDPAPDGTRLLYRETQNGFHGWVRGSSVVRLDSALPGSPGYYPTNCNYMTCSGASVSSWRPDGWLATVEWSDETTVGPGQVDQVALELVDPAGQSHTALRRVPRLLGADLGGFDSSTRQVAFTRSAFVDTLLPAASSSTAAESVNLDSGEISTWSVSQDLVPGNKSSWSPHWMPDGSMVFASAATNLLPAQSTEGMHIFLKKTPAWKPIGSPPNR